MCPSGTSWGIILLHIVPLHRLPCTEHRTAELPHLSADFMGEGSAEMVRLLLWELLLREPLCEEDDRDPERRKGCEKNSSKVRRSTGLRLSSPCSSETQALDSALRMGSGTCASCRSIARSSAT